MRFRTSTALQGGRRRVEWIDFRAALAAAVVMALVSGTLLPVATADDQLSIVRIENNGEDFDAAGSGTLIKKTADYALVLTCWHVFADGEGKITVRNPSWSQSYTARLLLSDEDQDVAILAIDPPEAPALSLADNVPPNGSAVEFAGYARPDALERHGGELVTEAAYYNKNGTQWHVQEWTGHSTPGYSGGPLLDSSGRVTGLITGNTEKSVIGPGIEPIRTVLGRLEAQYR